MFTITKKLKIVLIAVAAVAVASTVAAVSHKSDASQHENSSTEKTKCEGNSVTITELQAKSMKVETIATKEFSDEREAVGNIDFNQEQTVQVSSPWQGRIVQVLVKAGDSVRKGETLYTIDSPDLVQAGSNLISTAGVLQMATKSLERSRQLAEIKGV